jgi:hypothetical protein
MDGSLLQNYIEHMNNECGKIVKLYHVNACGIYNYLYDLKS